MTTNHSTDTAQLEEQWTSDERWKGLERVYSAADVVRLRNSFPIEYSIARMGANRLWSLIHDQDYVNALGAMTGGQAVQMVKGGLKAIYLSGWQVAADANTAGQTYPDQSLYPVDAAPRLVERINNALLRADQIAQSEGGDDTYWMAPIVADAEAGFGGALNAYELMHAMIKAGAAGVHFEDQLASEKKCGHLGGKVLVPTGEFINKLSAARLAADVMGVPTILIARTDADSATLITSDHDERDDQFILRDQGRTPEGFFRVKNGIDASIDRALSYAPYADLLWMETGRPDLDQARKFSEAVRSKFPDKLLAYNCSPSFNWNQYLEAAEIAKFQRELGAMGFAFQFVTLAGFHALNHATFDLARGYAEGGMTAYAALQQREFDDEERGYTATRHQREVGTGYFDLIRETISGGESSTGAMQGSTETEQFH
ncbi:isocitrate lyase [soil metagenome]